MGGILEEYRKVIETGKENINNDFPQETNLNETQRSEYVKKLKELRESSVDMKNAYEAKLNQIENIKEKDLKTSEEDITRVKVIHAYCPKCGEELISKVPAMFNPFTLERICKHTCEKCGKELNLEHAYPRLAFYNIENKEISAYID